ncbi:hypothetical protein ABW21_db0207114 [Orbilia brochopaga]|nr:hypothetical protein ABW21_db0207114 [Drechslerella brochopaga]
MSSNLPPDTPDAPKMIYVPLIRRPLDPKQFLPELERFYKDALEPQKPNVRALISDIEAGIQAAPFYQKAQRARWEDLDWTIPFWCTVRI